jgi:Domain of unknown function (DUF1707)
MRSGEMRSDSFADRQPSNACSVLHSGWGPIRRSTRPHRESSGIFRRMKLPRSVDSRSQMISDLDRMQVLDLIAECHAEGYMDEGTRELAEKEVQTAVDREGLNAVLATLPKRRRDGSHEGRRRATEAEREDAIRRLEMYVAQGAITREEGDSRIAQVKLSKTPNDISETFHDLGPLGVDQTERRASKEQRDEAIRQPN